MVGDGSLVLVPPFFDPEPKKDDGCGGLFFANSERREGMRSALPPRGSGSRHLPPLCISRMTWQQMALRRPYGPPGPAPTVELNDSMRLGTRGSSHFLTYADLIRDTFGSLSPETLATVGAASSGGPASERHGGRPAEPTASTMGNRRGAAARTHFGGGSCSAGDGDAGGRWGAWRLPPMPAMTPPPSSRRGSGPAANATRYDIPPRYSQSTQSELPVGGTIGSPRIMRGGEACCPLPDQ